MKKNPDWWRGDGIGDLPGVTAKLDYIASLHVDAIWLSVFGGSAWARDSRRKQYCLHNFLASQPDLNFHSPEGWGRLSRSGPLFTLC